MLGCLEGGGLSMVAFAVLAWVVDDVPFFGGHPARRRLVINELWLPLRQQLLVAPQAQKPNCSINVSRGTLRTSRKNRRFSIAAVV